MKIALGVVLVILVLVVAAGLWLYTPDRPRAALEAQYDTPPTAYLTIEGMRLRVRDTGPRDAPAIVLLHGFGSSLETWQAWADILSSRYRVVRFDLPGFGLSGPDPTGDYSDARSLQIITGLMDTLGIARAALVGNSLGGKLAWMFAATKPARVDRLVLVSPDGFASPGFEYGKKPDVPAVMRLLPYVLPAAMLRSTLAPAYGNPAVLTDRMVARYRDMMLAPGVRAAMVDRMGQVDLQPPEPLLRRIEAPTLLLWGERDAMIPFSNARDYLGAIPNVRLVALPGLGHVPMEEAPAESLAPVLAFLAG